MRTIKLIAVTFFVMVFALSTASGFTVESQTIQEAPTTDLNILTDDLFRAAAKRIKIDL